jgi:hypothetical protein
VSSRAGYNKWLTACSAAVRTSRASGGGRDPSASQFASSPVEMAATSGVAGEFGFAQGVGAQVAHATANSEPASGMAPRTIARVTKDMVAARLGPA